SSTWKRQKLKDLQQNLNVKPADTKVKSVYRSCPCCKKGILITIESFDKRGPPAQGLWALAKTVLPISTNFMGKGLMRLPQRNRPQKAP
ncbi:hypothetical protein SAMN06265350_1212, partial [Solitalea koreensis]